MTVVFSFEKHDTSNDCCMTADHSIRGIDPSWAYSKYGSLNCPQGRRNLISHVYVPSRRSVPPLLLDPCLCLTMENITLMWTVLPEQSGSILIKDDETTC